MTGGKIVTWTTEALSAFQQHIRDWVIGLVPTKTSQLTNDSGFATSSQIPSTYVKDASVSTDGAKLTLTKQDNSTVVLDGGSKFVANGGISKIVLCTPSTLPAESDRVDGVMYISMPSTNTAVIGGRTYRTVTINGVTWMAENLDYKATGIEIGPSDSPTTAAAWYYNNNESTYGADGNKYGLLYNWHAVKHLNDNRATLIPGWHVPSTSEFDALASAVGGASVAGTKLKSTSGWNDGGNGTDDFGFSAFPAGCRYGDGGFDGLVYFANFWSADEDEYDDDSAYFRNLEYDVDEFGEYWEDKAIAYSVRLVKD